MKTGLVLEGGAMRGIFTAGVTDVFLEQGIEFDATIGVSAGACFGCNIKSRQIGRTFRYNMRFAGDKRYHSLQSLLTTGDLFHADFCYHQIPYVYDPFDFEAYIQNPMLFYVVCTDIDTGLPYYEICKGTEDYKFDLIRASASMPVVSKVVQVNGRNLLDGGIADPIPLRFSENAGFTKNVVILTQPAGYVKKKDSMLPLMKLAYRKYPHLVEAMEHRHQVYNDTLAYIAEQEALGTCFVVRPPAPLGISRTESDRDKLQATYDTGRNVALQQLEAIRDFLQLSSRV